MLNATFEPLCVVPARRALVLLLCDKAELVHASSRQFRSERASYPEPSVVRLAYFVKVPYQSRVALNRRAVFARDGHLCQYCGGTAENIDHVIPRSRGGTHTWDNVVAACRPCNARKENRTPQAVGLRLRRPPAQPHDSVWIVVAVDRVDPSWEQYLGRAPKLAPHHNGTPSPQLA